MLSEQVIGVDLGSAHTLIYVRGKGIVLREHSVVARNTTTGALEHFGERAWRMIGRTPQNIVALHPLSHGVIADFAAASMMLQTFLQNVVHSKLSFSRKPLVVVSVPSSATPVEQRAAEEAAVEAGAKKAITVNAGLAAAIGAGLPVAEPKGSMIVDIGAGTTEIAVTSLGGVVHGESLAIGGVDLDAAIVKHVRSEYSVVIGETTAEMIKLKIGQARTEASEDRVTVTGRSLLNGLPKSVEVTAGEVAAVISTMIEQITAGIRKAFEQVPAELAADIFDSGIVLTGGGAQLCGLCPVIAEVTSLPVVVADDPADAVAMGMGRVLDGMTQSKRTVDIRGLLRSDTSKGSAPVTES